MTHPLTAYRAQKGLSQPGLAKLLDVSYATINHIENGRRRPSPALARLMDERLGIAKEVLRPDVYA